MSTVPFAVEHALDRAAKAGDEAAELCRQLRQQAKRAQSTPYQRVMLRAADYIERTAPTEPRGAGPEDQKRSAPRTSTGFPGR